jgi:hypothetical protein
MTAATETEPGSKKMLWTGRIISGLIALFMLFTVVIGILRPAFAREGLAHLGYPDNVGLPIDILLLACTVIYAIPRTSVLGAILMTGYLGGATASHVRIGEPPYLAIIVGVLVWLGIFLRESRLRALVPLRS